MTSAQMLQEMNIMPPASGLGNAVATAQPLQVVGTSSTSASVEPQRPNLVQPPKKRKTGRKRKTTVIKDLNELTEEDVMKASCDDLYLYLVKFNHKPRPSKMWRATRPTKGRYHEHCRQKRNWSRLRSARPSKMDSPLRQMGSLVGGSNATICSVSISCHCTRTSTAET
eukprot:CAMPEP_0194037910 /NCGR_PEP_ID=MMETSP0009_2-20130614/10220_1 /TAXON_ID=210454 /ORGANISM="Grammatophora oceanica, Strain CCMP 410" /LENGTH=168 /DNA_ID=CAMNT_0038680251 /DNA_START=757 /DNA_END=1263 /DNA_ORIENTATION=-